MFESLSFEERLGLLVDREAAEHDAKRLATHLRFTALRHAARAASMQVSWRI